MMLSHTAIWEAIDQIAKDKKLSTSGLAIKAGLDATTFNKSKRVMLDGRERWPSTESIAKILEATKTTASDFFKNGPIEIPLTRMSDSPRSHPLCEENIVLPANLMAIEDDSPDGNGKRMLTASGEIRTGDLISIATVTGIITGRLRHGAKGHMRIEVTQENIIDIDITHILWTRRVLWIEA